MAPMKAMKAIKSMKAMKVFGNTMGKSEMAKKLATECKIKKTVALKMLSSLTNLAADEVEKNGSFKIPGLVWIKTRLKLGCGEHVKELFGKLYHIKPRPNKRIVKAIPVVAFKKRVGGNIIPV